MTNEPTTGEIVRALICVAEATECKDCRYKYPVGNVILCDHEQMNGDAADRLESQEQKIAELIARAESAERERDAAIADMKIMALAMRESDELQEGCCFACKYDSQNLPDNVMLAYGECPGYDSDDCFEWRGKPQDGGTQNG